MYTVGTREEVEAELQFLEVDLSYLSDDHLIDLWLRESDSTGDYKNYYGYNTDLYFWFTDRDQRMEKDTRDAIAWFYRQLGEDPCSLFDSLAYTPPDNDEIVSFLRGPDKSKE